MFVWAVNQEMQRRRRKIYSIFVKIVLQRSFPRDHNCLGLFTNSTIRTGIPSSGFSSTPRDIMCIELFFYQIF
jgi:hypothetical protein